MMTMNHALTNSSEIQLYNFKTKLSSVYILPELSFSLLRSWGFLHHPPHKKTQEAQQ